jgi:hypothetical protein
MRWDDEPYVRLYKRETPEWSVLSWQARALFHELLKRVDMAGLLMVGRSGVRGLAGLVRMPLDVVEGAMHGADGLLADGCVVEVDGGYLLPNFVEAQQARQSDRARKAEQRARDRATKLATGKGHAMPEPVTTADNLGQSVTNRDHESQNVTESHTRSHDVTRGHSEQSRAEQSRAEPKEDPGGGPAHGPNDPTSAILAALRSHRVLASVAHERFACTIAERYCREHQRNMMAGKSSSTIHPLADVVQCIAEAAEAIELDEAANNRVDPDPQRRVVGFIKAGPRRRRDDNAPAPMPESLEPYEYDGALRVHPRDPRIETMPDGRRVWDQSKHGKPPAKLPPGTPMIGGTLPRLFEAT